MAPSTTRGFGLDAKTSRTSGSVSGLPSLAWIVTYRSNTSGVIDTGGCATIAYADSETQSMASLTSAGAFALAVAFVLPDVAGFESRERRFEAVDAVVAARGGICVR